MPIDDPAEDLVKSLPPIQFLRKAAEGGGVVLDLLRKLQGQPRESKRPPTEDIRRNGMDEATYRKYLVDQMRQGQQSQDRQLEVKPPK